MLGISKVLTKNIKPAKLFLGLLIAVSIIGLGTAKAYAISENRDELPQRIPDQLYSRNKPSNTWQNVNGQSNNGTFIGNPCAYAGDGTTKLNNAGWTWISQEGNSAVDTETSPLQVTEGSNYPQQNLWLNTVAAFCDSAISQDPNDNGKILDRRIQQSKNVVTDAVADQGVTIDNIKNDPLLIDYGQAYLFSYRYAKQAHQPGNGGPETTPTHTPFKLNIPSSLTPRDEPYTITVNVTTRGVNAYKDPNDGHEYFYCVALNNGQLDPASGLDDKHCGLSTVTSIVRIKVNPLFAGQCYITKINGIPVPNDATAPNIPDPKIELSPNQTFSAEFLVKNTGVRNWPVVDLSKNELYILGTLPSSTNGWGTADGETAIHVDPNTPNSLGGSVLSGGTSTQFTTSGFRVDPNAAAGSSPSFSWNIVHYKNKNSSFFGSQCSDPVKIHIKANRPFVRVEGGDVMSGVAFKGKTTDDCEITGKTPLGSIQTNGLYSANEFAGFNGFSSSQYATFAGGKIGDSDPDNFLGNNGYKNGDGRRDLLFANTGVTGNGYGYYYDSQAPCYDVSEIINKASSYPSSPAAVDLSSGVSYKAANDVSISGKVPTGKQLSIIAPNGTVTIPQNVFVDSGASLTVIAKNVVIRGNVTDVAGFYVALSSIETCNDLNNSPTVSTCPSKLTVKGALAAPVIKWRRNFGTIQHKEDSVNNSSCAVGTVFVGGASEPQVRTNLAKAMQACSAELVQIDPSYYINSPFKTGDNSAGGYSNIPASTVELPPIY